MQLNEDRGRLILGGALVIIGTLFLVLQFVEIDVLELAWPFFIIIPGVLLLGAGGVLGGPLATLTIPGSIVTMVGLILLYQNATDHFESWAYAWALIIAAAGLGVFLMGVRTRDASQQRAGLRTAGVGLVVFVIAAAFFELVINISGRAGGIPDFVFPLLLILLGVALLLGRGLGSLRRGL